MSTGAGRRPPGLRICAARAPDFHRRFLEVLWEGSAASLLPELRKGELCWRGALTDWRSGGCLVLARGVARWMGETRSVGCAPSPGGEIHVHFHPRVMAVWESWDEQPYHALVVLGPYTLDGEGLGRCDALLAGWETYFRGGAYLAPLTQRDADQHGFLQMDALSERLARCLAREFGPFTALVAPFGRGFPVPGGTRGGPGSQGVPRSPRCLR